MVSSEQRHLDPKNRFRSMIARRLEAFRRLHYQRSEAEVFPWLEHPAAAVAILGVIAALLLNREISA